MILMDMIMPVMDGVEMLARLRKEKSLREIPVIMLTGDDAIAEEATDLLGDLETAARWLDEYVMIYPLNADVDARYARVLARLRRWEDAAVFFRMAIELRPETGLANLHAELAEGGHGHRGQVERLVADFVARGFRSQLLEARGQLPLA